MKLSIFPEFFTSGFWCLLLWMFLAFLLGWLLRNLFGSKGNGGACCDELKALKRKYANLESRYNAGANITKEKVQTVVPAVSSSLGAKSGGAKNVYAKLKNDNLQIIEGIGPKMDEVLKKHEVSNWYDLSVKSFDDLRGLLDKENPTRYKIIDPKTWPQQAKLAVDGDFEELISLQKALDTGKTNTLGDTDSKLEKMMVRLGLLKKWKKDDLKAIEGIGPKIAELFVNNGLKTWSDLSKASVNDMKKILASGGDRFKLADPGTWAQQAKLADQGKWDELQVLQDELDGGR